MQPQGIPGRPGDEPAFQEVFQSTENRDSVASVSIIGSTDDLITIILVYLLGTTYLRLLSHLILTQSTMDTLVIYQFFP